MKAYEILLILATLGMANEQPCRPFKCSTSDFGDCNECIKINGQVMAITRNICGEYTEKKCQKLFRGPGGVCSDGCNRCSCGQNGVASTKIGCPAYDYEACVQQHGNGEWSSGNLACYCTPCGMACR
ncbi:hypothetical protein BGZ63DRAFT_379799 [Mariannaea sp. PMI_226]|nr:hypothetical protein BGZ63DRAFT_379799 [Mariannaea sp. PMI_226]